MTASLWWHNLIAYSLQVAVLVTAGAVLAFAFRLRGAGARLLYWQVLLAACLALPVVQPWTASVLVSGGGVTVETSAIPTPQPGSGRLPFGFRDAALLVLAAGIGLRAGWLALGFWRLRRYRRNSRPGVQVADAMQAQMDVCARVCLSDEIAGPVTFGIRRPIILFPTRFLDLEPALQAAVACHELVHVRRRDWAFTVLEECIRALFWFHPAIWWLLGQIQLSREQVVDREVVRWTKARERYVDALLAMAGAGAQLDLAPAPLFLRNRHLVERVASILKEVPMSKPRLISVFVTSLGLLLLAGWLAVGSFPLAATPQQVVDAAGVTVVNGDANLMHRAPVQYPREALEKKIEGAVVLEVQIDEEGLVSDARVISGPQELRRAALESVLQWHYAKKMSLPATAQVSINFRLPEGGAPPTVLAKPPAGDLRPAILKRIEISGLPPAARDDLLSRLPVRVGDSITPAQLEPALKAIQGFDEHLRAVLTPNPEGATLRIFLPPQGEPTSASQPTRIRVGPAVQQMKLIERPQPVYPAVAKQARIQGVVRLSAIIGKDGTVQNLTVLNGHPLLVPAAMEAVKQWVYVPTLLNGEPVEVVTQIDVNFTLSE